MFQVGRMYLCRMKKYQDQVYDTRTHTCSVITFQNSGRHTPRTSLKTQQPDYDSATRAATSASTLVGTLTLPSFDTKYWSLKFHRGSPRPVASRMCFHRSDAVAPFTLPNFISTPFVGKFLPWAKSAISLSDANSCPPYSRLGNAKMTTCSAVYFCPSASNRA